MIKVPTTVANMDLLENFKPLILFGLEGRFYLLSDILHVLYFSF